MSFDEQPDGDPHGECAAEIKQLQIALKIKTEEHNCCAEDLQLALVELEQLRKRWSIVKEFHNRLRFEHWNGFGWNPLYGDDADKIVDAYIKESLND